MTRAEVPDDLAESLQILLDDDDDVAAARWLRADPRLRAPEATDLLEAAEGALVERYTPEARSRLAAYLRRCAVGDLEVTAPLDAAVVDPPVVALVREHMEDAEAAERRFAATADVAALDDAAIAWRAVFDVDALGSAYPGLVAALSNDAAGTFLRRFWAGGESTDLGTALVLFGDAVLLSPPRSAKCAHRLANQAIASREVYLRSGNSDALDLAERSLRDAVAVLAGSDRVDPEAITAVLTDLALVLRDRHLLGDPDALDEAIAVAERAADTTSVGARVMLADLLGPRAQRDGSTADLERAAALLADAVRDTPPDSADRPRRMVDLAIALTERFGALGGPSDLDRAIGLCEQAVDLLPTASPDAPHAVAQLAVATYRRFEASGRLDDLDRAVELLERVVRDAPAGEVAAGGWRSNLATALIQRARRADRPVDLDRAVDILRAAVDDDRTDRADGTDRYVLVNNFGNALRDRARLWPTRADLDEAVDRLREALATTAPGTSRHATTRTNLAVALRDRYQLTGDRTDLDEAVAVAGEAVGSGAESDVDQPRRYITYALVSQDCAGLGVDRARAAADHAYRKGCMAGVEIDPESTLVAAQDWAAWAAAERRWQVASEAYQMASTAVATLVATQVRRRHQETWLRAAVGTAASAAYVERARDRLAAGVVALERGRAILLSELVGSREADLDDLELVRPDVAARYRAALGALRIRRRDGG